MLINGQRLPLQTMRPAAQLYRYHLRSVELEKQLQSAEPLLETYSGPGWKKLRQPGHSPQMWSVVEAINHLWGNPRTHDSSVFRMYIRSAGLQSWNNYLETLRTGVNQWKTVGAVPEHHT